MRIRWHGHACFEFQDSKLTVVTDPHDGRSIGIKAPNATADIVLMSHGHYDHNAVRVVKGKHVDVMSRNEKFEVKGLQVEGFRTFHDASHGAERGENTVYLFEMEGITFCHCGDLGCIPEQEVIDRIHGVDFMFVPTGEVYTMPLPEVKRFIELVNPRIVVPMHYRVGGLSIPITPLDPFLDMIPEEAIDYIGNEIEVSAEDLPDHKECWVFDR